MRHHRLVLVTIKCVPGPKVWGDNKQAVPELAHAAKFLSSLENKSLYSESRLCLRRVSGEKPNLPMQAYLIVTISGRPSPKGQAFPFAIACHGGHQGSISIRRGMVTDLVASDHAYTRSQPTHCILIKYPSGYQMLLLYRHMYLGMHKTPCRSVRSQERRLRAVVCCSVGGDGNGELHGLRASAGPRHARCRWAILQMRFPMCLCDVPHPWRAWILCGLMSAVRERARAVYQLGSNWLPSVDMDG